MKRSEIALGLIRIPLDFLLGIVSFLISYKLRLNTNLISGIELPLTINTFPSFEAYLRLSMAGSLGLVAIFACYKLYALKNTVGFAKETRQIFTATTIWLMLVIAYYFLIRDFPFSRLALLYTWASIIIFVSLGRLSMRIFQRTLLAHGIGRRRIAIIGNNVIAVHLLKYILLDPRYEVVGTIGHGKMSLGQIENLEKIMRQNRIEEIIQTKSSEGETKQHHVLEFCRQNHIQYHFVPDLLEIHQTNIDLRTISGIPLLTLKPTPLDGWKKVIKRSLDLLGAIFGLIILSPLLLLIAILIKTDSKGPVLFSRLEDGSRTLRIGQHGQKFHFLKFRTMKHNTHQQRYTDLAERNIRKGSPLVKIKSDPRITKIGKFLRQTALDELPQLYNVLKGDMSLVGPRPHLPEEVEKYENHHKFVLTIKPGITGLAQISGRSDLNFEEEIQLDSYYIENWSLFMDIKTILKTFAIPFSRYSE